MAVNLAGMNRVVIEKNSIEIAVLRLSRFEMKDCELDGRHFEFWMRIEIMDVKLV